MAYMHWDYKLTADKDSLRRLLQRVKEFDKVPDKFSIKSLRQSS
jgi:hypothetical protein